MPERIRKILDWIVEWWKKFNNKQRGILVSATAVVIIALAILAAVVNKPNYVTIYTASELKEASEINTLLTDGGISFNTTNGGMTFQVDTKDEAEASYLLAENDYPSATYDISNVTSGSFSTTESDKQKLYQDYLEKKFADHLSQFEFIKSANVDITLPDNDGTILASQQQGTAAVQLVTSRTVTDDQAYGLALFIATELGNDGTEGVTIIDQDGNVLYSGSDANAAYATTSSQLNNTTKMMETVKLEIESVLLGTKVFSNLNVGMNLAVDYSQTTTSTREYYGNDEDSNTNMISSISEYEAESNGGSSAIPGTDSNDDNTTYYIDDDGLVSYSTSSTETQYLTNEKLITEIKSGGTADLENSSVAISAVCYKTYSEDVLREAGELEEMTFEEFKAANSELVAIEVEESFIELVAAASGVPADNIAFVCYEQPVFIESDTSSRTWSDILQIALAVLIFVLLGYVVFRSTRKQPETEAEAELSVESLLEATAEKQNELDDIGYVEKSETRILIEKFVDENPDAVAVLLRNWLSEDWE